MIERMKKMSLLIYHQARETFLSELQNLGAVHMEIDKGLSNEEIIVTRDELSRVQKAAKTVAEAQAGRKETLIQKQYPGELKSLLEAIDEKEDVISGLERDQEHISKEIEVLAPWGNFSPEKVKELAGRDIPLHFFVIAKSALKKIDISNLPIEIISVVKGAACCMLLEAPDGVESDIDLEMLEQFKMTALPARLPETSLEDLQKQLKKLEAEYIRCQEELFAMTEYSDYIQGEIMKLEDRLQFLLADTTLKPEADGSLLYITGWVPKRSLKNVSAFLDKEDVIYFLENPVEGDEVPVKLRNYPFFKLFEPITKMNSLPQYNEIDPTPFFAPFFALFFGLCLADVGYGLIILAAVITGLILKWKNKSLRSVLFMGFWLGLATVISGFALDTFFGADNVSRMVDNGVFPRALEPLIFFKGDLGGAMGLAILLGIVQILIGFLMRMVNKMKIYGFTGALQPFGTICIFLGSILLVGPMVSKGGNMDIGPIPFNSYFTLFPELVGISNNTAGLTITLFGVALVLLFNNLRMKIFVRPALGLWELYGTITGLLGDTLSYIRLFALGLAGGLLGQAFNDIAFMIRGDEPGVGAIIGMIAVMIVGHTLNLGLAALSAFVHPLRLILLEFYNAVEFTGGATPYSPFQNRIIISNNNKGASS
jgi:V/A-type H+-transporting ATPase subunit I